MANEKRLIDAYEFYRKFIDLHTIPVGEQRYVATWRISDLIADAPTVDAVEVVRCEDCRHWKEGYGMQGTCYHFDDETDDDDFCSYGERKDNG